MPTLAFTLNTASRWVNYMIGLPMMVFGTIGAILTIIIFSRQPVFWRNPTIIYVLTGAIMTTLHLPSIYFILILTDGFTLRVYNTGAFPCALFRYLTYVTTIAPISCPCWAAFDQYASTHRDALFRNRWSRMKVVRYAIVGTTLFWIIFYLPMFFFVGIRNNVCIFTDATFSKVNNYLLSPLVFTITPCSIIMIFTHGTMKNLRSTAFTNRHDRLAKQIRRMLIPQLLVLWVLGFPYGTESIYLEATATVSKDATRLALENFVRQLLRLCYHINFVSTFYIYLYMSSEVRKALKKLIGRSSTNTAVNPMPLTIETNMLSLQRLNNTKSCVNA